MPRAVWKGPFIAPFLMKLKFRGQPIPENRKIWTRESVVLPEYVNRTVQIHNGAKWVTKKITEECVGHKFGEFAPTRVAPVHCKKEKSGANKNLRTGKRK